MILISDWTTCALCDERLGDRPFLVTPWESFDADLLLRRYHRVPIHYDCAAAWPDRERFSRACYVSALAEQWMAGNVLHATRDWFLSSATPRPDATPTFLDSLFVDVPPFVEVHLATWPFSFRAESSEWERYVDTGFRESVMGIALSDAESIMAEVRKVAPSAAALQQLRSAHTPGPGEQRTFVDFGEHLATFWPEAAASTNWGLLDEEDRIEREDLETQRREQAEAIELSNTRARRLVIELLTGKPLQCPHCEGSTREMRFIEQGASAMSYFICGLCARSFSGCESAAFDEGETGE